MYNKWGKFFEFTYGGIQVEILKVSSRSVPNSVAGAVSAIKAIAIARGYLARLGIDLICIPAFASVLIDGEERTAIKLICEER